VIDVQNIVVNTRQLLPSVLTETLPKRLCEEVEKSVPAGEMVEELRLRRGRCASLTVAGRNLRLSTVFSGVEMDDLLLRFCEGSLYAHSETISQGYLTLKGGIRVGVCGRAGVSEGNVTGVSQISALSIRIPHPAPPVGEEIALLLHRFALTRGVLIYAPPAVGKTTLLRSVAARMAGGDRPLRVAVVDTRGELGYALSSPSLLLDLLSGYPRGIGLSIAARTLSAQLIVCDEIGDLGEAREIVEAHNCGVPLLASAHAADVAELLARPGMRLLHEARCFGAYVGLSRRLGGFDYEYDVMEWEAADALL
jgi:stage III sporulation protein AA